MYIWLISFLSSNGIHNSHQHGFRQNHNASTACTDVLNFVTEELDEKRLVLSLFLDVSKTFDSLSHPILLSKLFRYGIRRVVHKWFSSYLSDRFQHVDLNKQSFLLRFVSCGVPQGGILSPILYALFVNDIFRVLNTSVHCVLYSEDTALCISSNDINSIMNNASQLFAVFFRWFRNNFFALYDKKSYFMVFHSSHMKCVLPNILNFYSYSVKHVTFTKYL